MDNFKDFFAKDVAEQNEAVDYVNQSAINTLEYLLNEGFSVVMEGIFQNPKYVSSAVGLAKQKKIESKVYELECSLKTLQERDKVRVGVKEGCRKPLGDESIAMLDQVIKDNPWSGSEKLNTEKLFLEECVEKLMS